MPDAWNGVERRRAPRAEREVGALALPGATPVTTAELARWTGLSRKKILADVDAGELHPASEDVASGSRFMFPVPEALRYLRKMGVTVQSA